MEYHTLGRSRRKILSTIVSFRVHGLAKHDSSLSKYGIFNKKLINDILCNNYEILRNHQNKPKFILNTTNFLEIFQIVYLLE